MKVRIKLVERTSEGEPCPTPVVRLRVRDKYGTFAELRFRVDTQADVSVIPARQAAKEAIPFSREREGAVVWAAGTEEIRAWVSDLVARRHLVEATGYRQDGPDGARARGAYRVFVAPYRDFMDRFAPAYRAELAAFVETVREGGDSACSLDEARAALLVAVATDRSRSERRPVAVAEVTGKTPAGG